MQAIRKSKPRERLLFTLLTETGLWMRDSPANVGLVFRGCLRLSLFKIRHPSGRALNTSLR